MGGRGSSSGRASSGASEAALTGDISFADMMKASKNSISFDKTVTVLPDGYMPKSGRKKDLEFLINQYNINEVVINMYRDKAGANDLQRMKNLGFEIQAQTKGEAQAGSAIPPRDYYYMVRTGKATSKQSVEAQPKKTQKNKATRANERINIGTTKEQRRAARAAKRQTRAMKYGRPKGSQ